jgi:hypothetical protein
MTAKVMSHSCLTNGQSLEMSDAKTDDVLESREAHPCAVDD